MICHVSLSNFRKFKKLELDTNSNLVILTGANAIGKTTVLESIYLASTFKSHRTNEICDLIKENEPFARAKISDLNHTYEVIVSESGKKGLIDNVKQEKASSFIANLHTVMFSPEDLTLVTGSPSKRRRFMDLELSLLNKKYLACLSETKYFLHQRNDFLKENKNDMNMLSLLTNEFISKENLIVKSRLKFIDLLNEKIKKIHGFISNGERLELKYISSYDIDNAYEEYKRCEKKDIYLKSTTIGYHHDDFSILLNDRPASDFASQGQIRNIAISIKIALVMVYEDYLKESPILLLDDVLSELDNTRQTNLVKFLIDKPQTFITTTSLDGVLEGILEKALIIKL